MPFRVVSIVGDKNAIKTGLNIKGKVWTQKIGKSRIVPDSGLIVFKCLKNTMGT